MGDSIQQCSGEPLVSQHFRPLLEWQVARKDNASAFVGPANHVEQQFNAGFGKWYLSKFVEHDKVVIVEPTLRKRIRQLAEKHKRYGVRRILAQLRREAWRLNKKRLHRIWKEEGLQRKRKRIKRRACGPSKDVLMKAEHPNHVRSYDFTEDRTERGGKLRIRLSILADTVQFR